jgi:Domain of unknown function (DUF927)
MKSTRQRQLYCEPTPSQRRTPFCLMRRSRLKNRGAIMPTVILGVSSLAIGNRAAGPRSLALGCDGRTKVGLTVEVEVGRGKNATIETVWVSAPFEVLGLSRTPHSDDWGKWIRWRDKDGRIHTKHIGDELLQGDTASICSSLANKGLTVNRSAQRYLVSYLSRASVKTRVTIVERTGWHEVDGQMAFVLTDSTIGCGGCEHIILNTCAKSPYSSRGSLKDWQD